MSAIPRQIRDRVEKLRREIEHHRYLYHVLDRQEISDAALDSLKHELVELERQYPTLVTPDSPTQRVGGQPVAGLGKVRHQARMLSLEDVFSLEELQQWETRWKKTVVGATSDYLVDLKLDGLAVSLVYDRGELSVGATRGDGTIGEDVTHSLRTIDAIPLRLNLDHVAPAIRQRITRSRVEIRGEVVMRKDDFVRLNDRQRAAGQPEFANPRNVSAGSIRQLDPKLTAARRLSFYAWELVTDLGPATIAESYDLLKQLGIKVNPLARVCSTLAQVETMHAEVIRQRESLDFWIDGLVVKINDRQLFRRLGVVGKAPRAATAYKFPAEQVTTVVEEIQVQVGRTGAVTPVAHLKPVQVAGTTVSRATLHNADEIKRLDVRIGDTVILQKAGDIIPDVVEVLKKLRPTSAKPFHLPTKCPVCHRPLKRQDGEVILYCVNSQCPARRREALYHFVSKKALDITSFGPSTIDVLVDEGLLRQPADIFKLRAEQLIGLPLFAEKKAEKLIEGIRKSRTVTLERFIYSLGIRHVGEQTAIDLAHHFHTIERFMRATADDLSAVPNIGQVVAESIAAFFASAVHRQDVTALLKHVRIDGPARTTSSTLSGKTVVVTGSLESMSREEAHSLIRSAGGTVGSAVSAKTAYLVVGDKPGSKLATAKKLGVPVLSEVQFRRMVQ